MPDTPDVPDAVAALQASAARLRAENAELKAENAELRARNAELEERVARLERLLSRNSGNSSMPPSTDDLPGKKPPARMLLECLRHREADVLRFLSDTAIPPTSNQAERDLRPAKTQQKISGRLRSETATRYRYAIRGYASTAAKHRLAIFTAIRDALAGNPWIPPIPATT